MADQSGFDALVVGGGPAGLTGALYLARFRRRVILFDDGRSRAVRIPRSHNMPGYPNGVVGAELIAGIRHQAERYGVEFASGRVETLARYDGNWRADTAAGEISAQAVLLATGATDLEPSMPHLAEAVRTGALRYCPVCDGFEVIDKKIGVIANGSAGVREALYLRHFTGHLSIFPASSAVDFSEEDDCRLSEAGIRRVEDPIASIRLSNGGVTVRHGNDETHCDSLYCALGMRIHTELVPDADVDDDGYLLTDRRQQTSVEGIYAAGDVAQGLNQISVAMGTAASAASAIHLALRGPKAAGIERTGSCRA